MGYKLQHPIKDLIFGRFHWYRRWTKRRWFRRLGEGNSWIPFDTSLSRYLFEESYWESIVDNGFLEYEDWRPRIFTYDRAVVTVNGEEIKGFDSVHSLKIE